MKQVLSYILENILDEGTDFKVEEEEQDGNLAFKIYAPKEQVGKIIGKSGRTINSMKNILKIKAVKENKRVDVQVFEKEA
ncbi:MAG: hypothetical protein A2857_06430 [Candidatus Levybacteria bacterium RIFCSPHIGHO2_01_FULL_36_15]|nr:MAG: hypothetical protein A2857_06430 [Candidatus Levybacteria bacterium RIFCSPHIGHO2_01_FULL_36_15]OGH39006.1 MAG: hypothetical protein A2905_06665 [Candidatus Levybacteria bacterium RIFCSPLOWO2_01_FULL_36_10]